MPGLPPHVFAFGFSRRKQAILRRFLPDVRLSFPARAQDIPPGAALLLWGSAPVPDGAPADVQVIRAEDGFLRSVGLGADLVQPVSWIIDRRGIYFDATRPSDLEHILQTTDFTPDLLARARSLRERIVTTGLTKYNEGSRPWQRPHGAQRLILVPGQVESDASLKFGAPGIRKNMDLLRAVREANPDATILYKPHPDVTAGLRAQGLGEDGARQWCDDVIVDVVMGELLPQVDEVHVLTSLAGFEALLRGKAVTCYGQPFYSGWGLTTDIVPPVRRTRSLTLDALVAGTLLLYPAYVSRKTGKPASAEEILDELIDWRAREGGRVPLWRRALRPLLGHLAARRGQP